MRLGLPTYLNYSAEMTGDEENPSLRKTRSEIPDWDMDSRRHVRASMLENSELWVMAARYGSMRGAGRESRIAMMASALDIQKVETLAEWQFEALGYSPDGMQMGGRTKGDNPDRPARAFYIQAAVVRLLELVGAPDPIISELKYLLKPSQPDAAEKRAQLQAALIEYPELANSPWELAKKAECDRKLVERYLGDGSVQKLPLDT